MKRIIGVGLIVVGIILLVNGYNMYNSLGSQMNEFLTGSPPEKAIWYLIGGGFSTIAGIYLTIKN
ncbi:MAG: DUF3185 family protein [Candidatus Marinimicrobia bacterium]|nr:DUF3185 family protein [Candidatus Neomarinimicrobiota bacterium]